MRKCIKMNAFPLTFPLSPPKGIWHTFTVTVTSELGQYFTLIILYIFYLNYFKFTFLFIVCVKLFRICALRMQLFRQCTEYPKGLYVGYITLNT